MSQPVVLFEKTWGGIDSDSPYGLALAPTGNLYLTGLTYSFGTGGEVFLLKYDSSGSSVWQRTWGSNGSEYGEDIGLDSAENIYTVGSTDSFLGPGDVYAGDAFLLKFNSSGSLLSQIILGGGSTDHARGVVLDPSGNIYITGQTASFGAGGFDVFLLKLNSSGNLLWQETWGGVGNDDIGFDVALDSQGDIYVTGITWSFGTNPANVFLLKYNSSGNLIWQRIVGDGVGNPFNDWGLDVAIDPSSYIYVGGQTTGFGAGGYEGWDVLLLKFNSTGGLEWQRTWGGTSDDTEGSLAVDSFSNIYLTGATQSFGVGGNCGPVPCPNAFLLKINSSGNLLSSITWGGAVGEVGSDVAVDFSGRVFIVGSVNEAPPYTLGSGNSTLGIPNFTASIIGNQTGTSNFTLRTPSGNVTTPSGSQTYAGASDVILFKYGPPPPSLSCGTGLTCSINSNSNISNVNFAGNTLHFTASGSTGATGYANVTIPKSAVPNVNNLMVFVNNTKLPSSSVTLTMNSTHYFVYFTFVFQSSLEIAMTFGIPTGLPAYTVFIATIPILAMVLRTRKLRPR